METEQALCMETEGEAGDKAILFDGSQPKWDFPLEVWAEIFTHLSPSRLASMRLVCKRWNRIISDEGIWLESFKRDFGTGSTFPSVSNSSTWATEYVTRVQTQKAWKKPMIVRRHELRVGNANSLIGFSVVEFVQDKLLAFTEGTGDIAICNASDGKRPQQVFGDHHLARAKFYDMNLKHVFGYTYEGELFLENISAALYGNLLALVPLSDYDQDSATGDDMVTGICLNSSPLRSKYGIDAMCVTANGYLKCWNLAGDMVKKILISDSLMYVKSDFRDTIIVGGTNVHIISMETFQVLRVPFDDLKEYKMKVDFGGKNIVLASDSAVTAIEYGDPENFRYKRLNLDLEIVNFEFQTISSFKLRNRDENLPGGDGLLCALALSNGTIIVFDTRNPLLDIKPIQIFDTAESIAPCTLSLNSYVLAVGGYNGQAHIFNLYTGKIIKRIKPISLASSYLIPVKHIHLNEDSTIPNGVIICGSSAQYFQFGNLPSRNRSQAVKKKLNSAGSKTSIHQDMKDQFAEYELSRSMDRQRHRLLDKFNGSDCEGDDTDISMALAISESHYDHCATRHSTGEQLDEAAQLQLAIELSKSTDAEPIDNELAEVLRLSLLEQ